MFLRDISGQLFADLALVLSVAVVASLFIAATVIPAAASKWLRDTKLDDPHSGWWDAITAKIMTVTDSDRNRKSLIAGLFASATILTWSLLPRRTICQKASKGGFLRSL